MDGRLDHKHGHAPVPHTHAVCFFRDNEYPADRIAAYVRDGLAVGGAVVFATPAHLEVLKVALRSVGTDVTASVAEGRLIMADAERAARSIIRDGSASRAEFDQRVASSVDLLLERHAGVRAYGEIVDILARAGATASAVKLEHWWNELLASRPVELLCGYALHSFASAATAPAFRDVCDEHGIVEPSQGALRPEDRVAAELEQAVAALHTEVVRRQQAQTQHELLREDVRKAQSQAQTATEHLARLQHFTSALSEATSVDDITKFVLAELENTFQADVATIALASDDGDRLRVLSRDADPTANIIANTLSSTESALPIAGAYRSGLPVWLTEPATIARESPRAPADAPADAPQTQCVGAVPLVVRGRRLGAIGVRYHNAARTHDATRALIDDYARQVALAVDRALAHDAAQAVRVRLQLLADATARIAQAKLDLRQIIDALAREVTRAGFAQRCTIDLHTLDGTSLVVDEGVLRGDHGVASSVVAPLQTTSEMIGTLTVVRPLGQPAFTHEDKQLLRDLADRAALCIENALLYERSRVERERTERERLRAEAANRAKDEFLAMLGHELRNPLSPIRTAVHLMRLRNPSVQIRERTIIERQVNHMVRLVDDLLDVSRIARGKVELKRTPVDLSQIVADAVEIASPLLEERAHELRTSMPHEPLIVYGDANRLAQVVANLLTNAAKYTPRRGRIEVRASADAGRITLAVCDDGNGIEPELMPRLFDLFMQGKQASDRQKGGLGLGLAIARNIVEMHNGTLRASSDGPGKGSEFTLELPRFQHADASNTADVGQAQPMTQSASRRVLVVDDNTDAADLIADALQSFGHSVKVAYDGPSALQIAADFHPELALLDIGLPVMDGYELGRRLATVPGCEQVKRVALTGYGQTTDRQRSQDAGFDEHLVKPIDLERILAVIDRL